VLEESGDSAATGGAAFSLFRITRPDLACEGGALIGAGTVLAGRYEIAQRIAIGGMGEVWRGVDRVLGRTVAVKLLRAPLDKPAFVKRFRAEARIMATISHPGVVDVYDFGDDPAAGVYLVMKYIDGESLARTLHRDKRLTAEATMRLVADAAEALQAAHEKGVMHRDVKPGNLLLRPDGSTVLTDFGIARSAAETLQTSTGLLLGTAPYIAPERAIGRPAIAQSDIYSLGVVAYECLAGRLPFEGKGLLQIALRHAHDEPPALPEDVPPSVREVVERAMAKDPAARWPSGAALAAAARGAIEPEPTLPQISPTVPTRGRPGFSGRHGRRLLVAGVAALAIATLATAVVLDRRRDGQTADPAANPGAGNSATAAGLTAVPGATSQSAVRATNPTSVTGTSSSTRADGAASPSAPTNLTATPVSATTIRLRWTDNSNNESGFTVIDGTTSRNTGANATTYDWYGLTPDTHTCFKVRAYNASGVSAYSPTAQQDWACATSLSGAGPAAPTNLTATPVGPTSIRLQWTDNANDESGFTVFNSLMSRNVGANATSSNWDGLAPGTYMCFKVRAYNSSGVSAYSPTAPQDWVCTTTPNT
jgi:serine/threonine protein kinase